MTLAAFGLVFAAAVLHASWNLLAKRAGAGGTEFVWLVASSATVLYAPIGLAALAVSMPLAGHQIAFMAGSAVLHVAYFTVLQHGYRVGDLSVVYPLARGTGPLLTAIVAILFVGERPSLLAVAGAGAVSGGVVALGFERRLGARSTGVGYGLATGVVIAAYTLWDRHAIAVLALSPLLYDWASNLGRTVLLGPLAWRRRSRVREVWTAHRREVLGVALLSPAAYILILVALQTTPVSYVAPAREMSILFGALLGARYLAEGDPRRRVPAAAAIALGVIALAVG